MQSVRHTHPCQLRAPSIRKKWLVLITRTPPQPAPDLSCRAAPQGNLPLFASLPVNANGRSAYKRHIADAHGGQFGDACAGVVQGGKHDAISLSRPSTLI